MDPVRIADLLAPFVTEEQRVQLEPLLPRISTYIDILLRWNARINLTAIRNPEEIVTRHFGESFFAARHLFPGRTHVGTAAFACPIETSSGMNTADSATHLAGSQSNDSQSNGSQSNGSQSNGSQSNGSQSNGSQSNRGRAALQGRVTGAEEIGASAPVAVADIGSGAGFPGVPLKLWAPEISLTLIESNHKKATFLREIARALTLTDINIQNVRAEVLSRSAFDVVTLRAVERFETVVPIASSLVKPAGRLALLIGTSQLALAGKDDTFESIPIPQSSSRLLVIAHRNIGGYMR
jgi:16S rRNA (guanine(527)-N(7))-methyltransferase RsmG